MPQYPQMDVNAGQVAGYVGTAAQVTSTTPPALPPDGPGDFVRMFGAGAPTAGVAEVQTITFGGTPTGGTFTLKCGGQATAAISWSATNNTLRDNVDTALEALIAIGTAGVATAVGTMTAGIGTLTLTFPTTGPALLVGVGSTSALTGTAPTIAVAVTTPGVFISGQASAGIGSAYIDQTNGNHYINAGTKAVPVWKLVTRAA